MNWGHPERGKILLLAGDLMLAGAAVILAKMLRGDLATITERRAGLIAIFMLVYSVSFYIFDLYDVRSLNGARTITRLMAATALGTSVMSLSFYLLKWQGFSRSSLGISVALLIMGSSAWRAFYKKHQSSLFKRRNVLMIGATEEAMSLHAILESKHSQYDLCGFMRLHTQIPESDSGTFFRNPTAFTAIANSEGVQFQPQGAIALEESDNFPHSFAPSDSVTTESHALDFGLVSGKRLEELALHHAVDTIVIRQNSAVAEFAESLTRLRFQGVRISTMPDICSQVLEELPLDTLSDTWFLFATGFNVLHVRVFRKIKRLADIVMACTGLFVTAPLMVAVAIAIKLESPGPILFRQWRVGWMEKPFALLKFRSMRQDAESDGKPQWASVADSRATRVGAILRKLHIDEIPQMINVLLGEMSFVGPRPERPVFVDQLKQIIPFYSLRHHLPPGITGWAQVNYPYGASVEDARRKLQYDLFYVRNASPTMDLRILLRTARVILFRRGSR